MLRVGLTGGIASGKSEVASRLAALGAVVIDADVLARSVVAPGTEGFAELLRIFGEEILTPDGELDRRRLGAVVFDDTDARRRLEGIIHPRVRARSAELEAAAVGRDPDAIVVHDIPLLVETGQADRFDVVAVVDAPEELRLERLTRLRGMSADEARSRIASQADPEQRLAVADLVVDNQGTREDLDRAVEQIWHALRSR